MQGRGDMGSILLGWINRAKKRYKKGVKNDKIRKHAFNDDFRNSMPEP